MCFRQGQLYLWLDIVVDFDSEHDCSRWVFIYLRPEIPKFQFNLIITVSILTVFCSYAIYPTPRHQLSWLRAETLETMILSWFQRMNTSLTIVLIGYIFIRFLYYVLTEWRLMRVTSYEENSIWRCRLTSAGIMILKIRRIDDYLGAVSIRKTVLPGMAIPMLKIRRPNGRLIFNMENAIRR